MSRAKSWCYTLNNPSVAERTDVAELFNDPLNRIVYHVFGREQGESGTPHLQGFILFSQEFRLTQVRNLIPRAHWEKRRGTLQQASEYCKKDGDFDEFGTLPASATQGRRSDWDRLREHIEELDGELPTERSLRVHFPGLMARYERAVWQYIDALLPEMQLPDSEPIDWQRPVVDLLESDADDRLIRFYVDPVGNSGKTWLCKYLLAARDDCQYLRPGKISDLAHAINPHKRCFLIDVPRDQMENLQYSVLEQLKDGMIFSPKYDSCMKMLRHTPHVLVFCNEYPRPGALSIDRVSVFQIQMVAIDG